MTNITMRAGKGTLTNHGKRLIAESMYHKGKGFIGAAILMSEHQGHEYVVLHLLCQGVERALKGLILLKDYDAYRPRLKTALRHDLEAVASEASVAYGLNPLRPNLAAQLHKLNLLYGKHLLRYGSFHDVLVDARSIPYDLVLRRLAAIMRLADRQLSAK